MPTPEPYRILLRFLHPSKNMQSAPLNLCRFKRPISSAVKISEHAPVEQMIKKDALQSLVLAVSFR